MPIPTLTNKAYLVIDNCVLSMLTDCYCDSRSDLSGAHLLRETQQWLLEQLNILISFTNDNLLHTTQSVSLEYLPQNGILGTRRVDTQGIRGLVNQVRGRFELLEAGSDTVRYLRELPNAPKRLINPTTGLSEADLSLVHLGLHLTRHGSKVVILSNDQDLLQFASWVRTQISLRKNPINPLQMDGLSCLVYLDLIHRSCEITSDQMSQFIAYMIKETGRRMAENNAMALHPQKGARILEQIAQIQQAFSKSVQIKAQHQGVAA